MGARYISTRFAYQQEESENSAENSGGSPQSSMLNDIKISSSFSPKKSKKSIQKRVISVPIKDVEGSRLKGEMVAPPSDSWAWRKYGQKPIKGSPHPRGYYRCSSSKGCPARKQVERSRVEANILIVTYSCEHNHPWPAPRNNNKIASNNVSLSTVTTPTNFEIEDEIEDPPEIPVKASEGSETNPEDKFGNVGEGPLISDHGLWFSDHFESTSSTMLEGPIFTDEEKLSDCDMTMAFTMRDEDESFFSDLGELPECSTVFRHGMNGRRNLTPWCGTTT